MQTSVREVPVVMQFPFDLIGEADKSSLAELKKAVEEMRDLVKNGFGPLSWSEEELADYFGISLKSMEQERRAGKIKYKRVKGKIHYSRRHVEEYLNS